VRGFRAGSFGADPVLFHVDQRRSGNRRLVRDRIKADLWDRRARIDFDVLANIKNQQLTAVGGASNSVSLINAKRASLRRRSHDFEALITENLRIGVNGSYNHTELKQKDLATSACGSGMCTVTDPIDGNGHAVIDGNPLPQAQADRQRQPALRHPGGRRRRGVLHTDWSCAARPTCSCTSRKEFIGQPLFEGGAKIGYNWAAAPTRLRCSAATAPTRSWCHRRRSTSTTSTGFINDLAHLGRAVPRQFLIRIPPASSAMGAGRGAQKAVGSDAGGLVHPQAACS
jgi:iron complex outermembrane receptor protein